VAIFTQDHSLELFLAFQYILLHKASMPVRSVVTEYYLTDGRKQLKFAITMICKHTRHTEATNGQTTCTTPLDANSVHFVCVTHFVDHAVKFAFFRSRLFTSNLIHLSFFPVEPIEHRRFTDE
jgi:hypothetical protein